MTINFTAMTWNLENLYPAGHHFGPKTAGDYKRKLDNLAYTILAIAPDVLAVQEVGDPASLAKLQDRLAGHYPHVLLSTHPDARGIRVGFVSRLPLENPEELSDFPDGALSEVPDAEGDPVRRMGRGVLKVQAPLAPNLRVTLVTAHLKSKLITYPGGRRSPRDENERARGVGLALLRRTAEAVALRAYVNTLVTNNDQPLIVLGDLNDRPEAVTTQILLGPEERSLRRPDKFDDVRLYNLADYLPAGHRYSRVYLKQPELIDHIMVSHELIFRHRLVDSFVDHLESIDPSIEKRRDALFPDHAPVYARFEIPEPSATGVPLSTQPPAPPA